jgi:hypothetical protein
VSIKGIGFSGKRKDWITWEEKFLWKARRHGYKDLLLGEVKIPESTTVLTVIVGSDEDEVRAKAKTRDLNEQGYSQWTQSRMQAWLHSTSFVDRRLLTMKMETLWWLLKILNASIPPRLLRP